jgi:hypothetical protein
MCSAEVFDFMRQISRHLHRRTNSKTRDETPVSVDGKGWIQIRHQSCGTDGDNRIAYVLKCSRVRIELDQEVLPVGT